VTFQTGADTSVSHGTAPRQDGDSGVPREFVDEDHLRIAPRTRLTPFCGERHFGKVVGYKIDAHVELHDLHRLITSLTAGKRRNARACCVIQEK
jgi:hypothetical protein